MDPVLLARLQFAFTVSFHIIFPAFTIGLAGYIAALEVMWLRTGRERYKTISRFWTKIFAVSFGMGVVPASFYPTSSGPIGVASRSSRATSSRRSRAMR